MTLLRAWLLFVAFKIDLAQKNLEEVPVQPDFDAHKVSVTAGPSLQCWGKDWVQCLSMGVLKYPDFPGALGDTATIN